MLTLVEENYLKAIFHLTLKIEDKVTITSISEQIDTTPRSVTEMIKKLTGKNLVMHEKYQGVVLTEEGKKIALGIIRKHRLWEVFLVDKLEFSWDEVHDIAEQLEHIQSDKLTEKLDKFLGYPTADPHGDPIPNANGKMRVLKNISLSELTPKEEAVVAGVKETSPVFLQYLDKLGIGIGIKIKVNDIIAFDGSVELKINKTTATVSKEVAKNVLVQKVS